MRKIILYIAASLDGYIATPNGSVDWLSEIPNPSHSDHGYSELLDRIDSLIMGGITYRQVVGFGVGWPYTAKRTYVVTHSKTNLTPSEDVIFIDDKVLERFSQMKNEEGKDIWLVGGGEIITLFLNHNLIDELQLCIAPRILGNGIALFPDNQRSSKWELKECKSYESGFAMLTYIKI